LPSSRLSQRRWPLESIDPEKVTRSFKGCIPARLAGSRVVPVQATGRMTSSLSPAGDPTRFRTCNGKRSAPRGQRINGS
jgi:hypothetical protein